MRLLTLSLFCATLLRADLAQVMAEPNLERRSKAALDYAEQVLKGARESYQAGDGDAVKAKLDEMGRAVDLADASLRETGKNPSRSPRYFKHAEIKTRDLLKRLDALAHVMDFSDRALVVPLKEKIHQFNERLLEGIMGRKRK
ncbi:MAG: hypothetical protein HYR60_29630 [Acidobacteria bacterium]|nr:hypothetical protein [Acidobacteriota bacterium]MBI3472213.1 hypothetical protein [Candidatus Solibacter usitatus]